MWTTMLCHPSAFVKLSVTMASLPHSNCPSDSQVYIAMGSRMLRGAGWDGKERDAGVTGKRGDWGQAEGRDGERELKGE